MDKLKVAVIGTGHLGKLHIKMFKSIENCEIIGVHDSNPEILKSVSSELNVAGINSIDELLKQVGAVSIAASTTAHHAIAKKCCEIGVHVFIEKPITATIREAEELVDISEKKNLNLQVGHIERFNPALVAMEKYISEPKFIQTDRLAQFNPRGTDVAVVLDLMIHDIDIRHPRQLRASRHHRHADLGQDPDRRRAPARTHRSIRRSAPGSQRRSAAPARRSRSRKACSISPPMRRRYVTGTELVIDGGMNAGGVVRQPAAR